ncbi:hypothetical protein BDF22DRAFT_653375 [Syncephalis plumigaleata]|nr:hypothetical protein BDF22DRAFT_653375 [Syncephalis plumigaleata]
MSQLEQERQLSLGRLHRLPDEIIGHLLLARFSDKELLLWGACSRWCYVLSRQEPHWRQRFLEYLLHRLTDAKNCDDSTTSHAHITRRQAMMLFDGSWFSAMQQLRQVVSLNRSYADILAQVSNKTLNQRFDHAPGLYWPMHIPAVRSWYLYESWRLAHLTLEHLMVLHAPDDLKLDLLSTSTLSNAQFQREYNATCTPVLIDGLATKWPAYRGAWSIDELVKKWGDVTFRVSLEQSGPRPDRISRFHLSIHDYVHYCRHQRDASPIYIFDAAFGERTPAMLSDYEIPMYFKQDYLAVLNEPHRPPYRWFVMGPARSGASWHVDPSGTSAWNTLVSGRKRWALYPNHVIPPGVKVIDTHRSISQSPTSLAWYQDVYPTLAPEQRPLECIQEPGQTIFVPGGWWHMVLNLNETIAVTQNFADDHNLEAVCEELVDLPKLWPHFEQGVIKQYPHLEPFMAKFRKDTKPTNDQRIITEGFSTRDAFITSFKDIDLWMPRCELAVQRYLDNINDGTLLESKSSSVQLALPLTLIALSTGQNPVFRVNEHWILKYYAHLAAGHRAYEMEVNVLQQLSSHATLQHKLPQLLAHDHLHDLPKSNDQQWSWPYILCQHLDGVSLQSLILDDKEEYVDWSQVTEWLADTLAALHTLTIEGDQPLTTSHTISDPSFRLYLQSLAKHCQLRHQSWRHLPPWLIEDIPRYIEPFMQWLEHGRIDIQQDASSMSIELIEQWLSRGSIIHGDLNAANLLGDHSYSTDAAQWQISSMIDFADTRFGADPLWDFIPLHISAFGGDTELFHLFLDSYRAKVPDTFLASTSDEPATTHTPHYPFALHYILTCYLLLWPYEGVIRWLVSIRSELCSCESLQQLSQQLWTKQNDEE